MPRMQSVWDEVTRNAKRVTYRANQFDDHPSYDSVTAIKECWVEVSGMWRLATTLANYTDYPNEVTEAIREMDNAVAQLQQRRRDARAYAKNRKVV